MNTRGLSSLQFSSHKQLQNGVQKRFSKNNVDIVKIHDNIEDKDIRHKSDQQGSRTLT